MKVIEKIISDLFFINNSIIKLYDRTMIDSASFVYVDRIKRNDLQSLVDCLVTEKIEYSLGQICVNIYLSHCTITIFQLN